MKAFIWTASLAAVVVLGSVVMQVPTEAHHDSAPFYDGDIDLEITGTVLRFNFRNPHSFIFLETETEDGQTVEYEIEMGAAVSMRRSGWTPESIKAGDRIRAVGSPSRAPGTFGMCCARLTQPDGSPIELAWIDGEGSPLQLVVLPTGLVEE